LLERRARVDPELVYERAPGGVIRLERLRLAAAAVEREHQLRTETLAQRMSRDGRFEVADELPVTSVLELRVGPFLERGEPKLLEPLDLRLRERFEREVGERRAAPEREGGAKLPRALGRLGALRLVDEAVEAREVELVR